MIASEYRDNRCATTSATEWYAEDMTLTYRPEDHRRLDLANAVSGVDLTDRDLSLLDWLAGWDQETTSALVDLITRARHAIALAEDAERAGCLDEWKP